MVLFYSGHCSLKKELISFSTANVFLGVFLVQIIAGETLMWKNNRVVQWYLTEVKCFTARLTDTTEHYKDYFMTNESKTRNKNICFSQFIWKCRWCFKKKTPSDLTKAVSEQGQPPQTLSWGEDWGGQEGWKEETNTDQCPHQYPEWVVCCSGSSEWEHEGVRLWWKTSRLSLKKTTKVHQRKLEGK